MAARPGSGIVWAELSTSQDDDHGLAAGILRADNAQTLQEIWNSEQLSTRDRLGTLVKFVPPVIANGKVFAATYDNAIAVYGLLPNFSVSASPPSVTVARTQTATYSVTVTPANGFSGSVALSVSPVPKGATATFSPSSISGSGSSMLNISTSNPTSVGSYTLTIKGAVGNVSHSANVTLVVTKR